MKILLVFIDMVRVDHLNVYNPSAKQTLLDSRIKKIGGTVYTRCYTPGPDTPRSMACMQTGLNPYFNGCDTRIKWPKYFVKDSISTIWDHAAQRGMKVNLCGNKNETVTGFFKYAEHDNIKMFYEPSDFINKGDFDSDNLSFVGIPDMHTAIGDYSSTEYAFRKGDKVVDLFFNRFLTDEFIKRFDYTIIFSDHGFQLASERYRMKSTLELLDDSRNNLLMFVHKKDKVGIEYDSRIASMTDLYATIEDLIDGNDMREGYSLLQAPERTTVHIEDHQDFRVYPEVMVKQWRVISDKYDYRTDVSKHILTKGEKEDIASATKYLEQNSPKYKEYVKQLQVWDYYATLKSEESRFYYAGVERANSMVVLFFKILNKLKYTIYKIFR